MKIQRERTWALQTCHNNHITTSRERDNVSVTELSPQALMHQIHKWKQSGMGDGKIRGAKIAK